MTDLPPALRANAADHAATGLTFVSGIADAVVPGTGAFFSVLIGQVIPGQRQERMAEYVHRLARRLRLSEGQIETLNERFEALARTLTPEQTTLFEEGALAATRATTSERIEGISAIVAGGINGDAAEAEDRRRLLQLVNELSEDEIVVLCSYTQLYGSNSEWSAKHEAVLEPIRAHMGSDRDTLDRELMRELRTAKLIRLGVLREKPRPNGKGTSRDISPLGRHVLRDLTLIGEDDF